MEKTDADLVSKKPYLSEVLDYAALQIGRANIISAPCHSGKTTAAKKIMEHHARSPGNVLYLIDTRAGKDALHLHQQAQKCSPGWVHQYDPHWSGDRPDRLNFAVMTYHQFGHCLQEESTFLIGIDLIICDEIHNLVKFAGIEASTNEQEELLNTPDEHVCCKHALESLGRLASVKHGGPMVVMLTATPGAIIRKFSAMGVPYTILDYFGKVYEDETRQRIYTYNTIRLPTDVHQEISRYYSSKHSFTGDLTFRQWVAQFPYDVQFSHGVSVMNQVIREKCK